jgi:hypothetical protein
MASSIAAWFHRGVTKVVASGSAISTFFTIPTTRNYQPVTQAASLGRRSSRSNWGAMSA